MRGTDDESIHATDCPAYVAPETAVCTCVEQCTEDNANVWCNVCGFDASACTGTDMAAVYDGDACQSTTDCAGTYTNGICTVCGGYQEPDHDENWVYQIANAGQLYWFANYVNTVYGGDDAVLTDNIVVNTDISDTNTNRLDWTPIGTATSKYSGTFDGQKYTISGLYFNNTDTYQVGLFGYVQNGTVKNVGVVDSYFCGKYNVGGVVGYCEAYNSKSASVENCYNTGIVKGTLQIGGVVGYLYSDGAGSKASIENCYNTGNVSGISSSGNTYVGGVVGLNQGYNSGTATVANCYNTGKVNCGINSYYVGGVAGDNTASGSGIATIENCYYLTGCATDGDGKMQFGIGANARNTATDDDVSGKVTAGKDENTFKSGAVAYLLNGGNAGTDAGVWKQTLGEGGDASPNFTGKTVYQITTDQYTNHEHDWQYSNVTGSPNIITIICGNTDGCSLNGGSIDVSLNAPLSATYDGETAYPVKSEYSVSDGSNLPKGTLTYSKDGVDLASGKEPTDAGEYTATLTLGEGADAKEAKVTYTIAKADPTIAWASTTETVDYNPNGAAEITAPTVTLVNGETFNGTINYSYTGTSSGDGLPTNAGTYTITASIAEQDNYNAATGTNTLTLTINKINPTCTAPTGLTATHGQTLADVTLTNPVGNTAGTWTWVDSTASVGNASKTGNTFKATFTPEDQVNYNTVTDIDVTVTVGKADSSVGTAPAAETNLSYTGSDQALVSAGTATGGTMRYALGTDGTTAPTTGWSETVPTGKNAGTYYVWYKAAGDANHEDTDPVCVEVTIAKATPSYDPPIEVIADYGDLLSDVALPDGYAWEDGSLSVGDATSTGRTFEATYSNGDPNYKVVENIPVNVIVEKVDVTGYTRPEAIQNLIYDTFNHTLTTEGRVVGGEIQFALGENSTTVPTEGWSKDVPQGTNAGTYYVWNKVVGDSNHNDVDAKCVIVTIAKADVTDKTASASLIKGSTSTVTLPALLDGAAYGTPAFSDPVTGASISGNVLTVTGGDSVTVDSTYTVTIPVAATTNYNAYEITVTLTGVIHEHAWSYTASGMTITATCSSEIGTCPDAEQSVTLVVPENTTYTGAVDYTPASYTGSIEGVTPTISYKGTNTNYDSAEDPVNADTYTVTMSAGDKTVSNTFTISPKSIANCKAELSQSSFEYSGKAPELTVTVTDVGVGNSTLTKDSDYTVGTVTGINKGNYKLTVTGEGNYSGSVELDYSITAKEVTITGATIQNVTYNPSGYTLKVTGVTFNGVVENETLDYSATAEVSTNAVGTQNATVTVTLNDSNYSLSSNTFTSTVSIDKAAATVTKAPTAKALTYDGSAQALVTAGETNSGTMQYSLDNSTWGTAIPNGTDAGSYTVYYKVVGDSNHSNSEPESVEVTINKAQLTPSIEGSVTKPYDGNTSVENATTNTLEIKLDGVLDADKASVSASATYAYGGANAGTTTVNATGITLSGDKAKNYELTATTASAGVGTITKVKSSFTPPNDIDNLVFNSSEQALITAGTATGGTMQYALGTDNTAAPTEGWSEDVPSGKDAGNYYVWYKVVGDSNHEDNSGGSVVVIIEKAAAPTVTIDKQSFIRTIATMGNTVDIAAKLPDDRGDTSCANLDLSGAEGIVSEDLTFLTPSGNLTFGTMTSETVKSGKITLVVIMANYADTTIEVEVELTDKTPLSITGAAAATGLIYNGEGQLGYTGTPVAEGYDGQFVITYSGRNGTTFEGNENSLPVNAGDYTVTFTIPDEDLHYTGQTSVDFTIGKASVTIKADDKSAYRNSSAPTYTYTVTGLIGSDTLTTVPTLTCDTDLKTNGTFDIVPSGADAGDNYSIGYENGTLTVRSRPSSSGGGSTPSTPTTPVTIPISGDENTINVDASVKGDTATVDEVDLDHLDTVIGDDVSTGTVTIDFSGLDSKEPITTVEIPSDVVKQIAEAVNNPTNDAESMEVILSDGTSIEFDAVALGEKAAQAGGLDITISIESHEDAELTSAQKNAVGDRVAYDINVTSGGKHISDMGGKITVHAPYELKPGEKAQGIVVWYVDDNGNRERCETSYDSVKKRVNWKTDHLSLYMIDYDETLAETCPKDDTCPVAAFTDADPGAWYHDGIHYALENGMMAGYGNGLFGTNDSITRGQIVTILWRLEGSPVVNYLMNFEDVPAEKYYTEAIRWANSQGIVGGYGNGKFGPDDPITRQQLATMVYRYEQYKGGGFTGAWAFRLDFKDLAQMSDYAYEPMSWCVMHGIVGGYGNGYLGPNDGATRAQAAAMLMRYCTLNNEEN